MIAILILALLYGWHMRRRHRAEVLAAFYRVTR